MALFIGKKLIADIQRLVKWGEIKGNITEQTDLKNALDSKASASDIHNATVTFTQNGVTMGTLNVNQSEDSTIALDGGGVLEVNWGDIGGLLSNQTDLQTALNGKVPTSRTINNKALTSDITLNASDVSALPSSTKYAADLNLNANVIQLKDQDGNNIGNSITIDRVPDVDNATISLNTYDELQAIGVIDSNGGAALPIWTGTRQEYEAIVTKDSGMIYNIIDDADAQPYVNIKRNIGELITSVTPLNDYGLHLLDGSLLAVDGLYRQFIEYIASLVTNYPDLFVTEQEWQTAVTTYGVCGKFVYDSVNNTVRLPKITGIAEGTTDLTALGDLVEAGLPNITGTFGGVVSATGCFSGQVNGGAQFTTDSDKLIISMDASRSSSIYGNSSTVQPQTIKVLYYIVVLNGVKETAEIQVEDLLEELEDKADIDLSNITSTAQNSIVTIVTEAVGSVNSLSSSGTINLTDNSINKINVTGNVTFALPSITDLSSFHQILVQLQMSTVQTLNLGTTYYFGGESPDLSSAGSYNLIYEYDNLADHWVVGAIVKASEV